MKPPASWFVAAIQADALAPMDQDTLDLIATAAYWPMMRAGMFRDHLAANGQAYAALLAGITEAMKAVRRVMP